ncbi:MAG: DUF2796 domain-containing protein [Gammaproteobacteria bacterium]|nr:DUF2796 domain-containing protein [Gammaproteobacteria bacterium]MBU1441502.1 DUF2796 domain-containing protein [Gammaproteobacteria bacterium]MBU2286790.1 DUF2796 domain-containing protein [Gammaproteobacteria bacterium]MBU2411058.1 DUF2796 domain-containing protein [Gammaproteobacteria bacterium]
MNWSFALLMLLAAPLAAGAQSGRHAAPRDSIKLELVVQVPTVVIELDSTLESIAGPARTTRGDGQATADNVMKRLRAEAPELFKVDPAANCKLGPVNVVSEELEGGQNRAKESYGQAELQATFGFNCTNAAAAKFVDVDLFEAFKDARQIDAQIDAPQGQFKRMLKRPNTRLGWGG